MFLEIYVLKNFESFTGKHLRKHPQTCKFIKKRLQHKCFPVKLLRTPFSTEQRRWLLFKINNRNKSVKRCFSDIPYPQPISSNLQLSQWQTNLKIHSLNKHFFRQSFFVTDLQQTPFFLKYDLNINNFAVLLVF